MLALNEVRETRTSENFGIEALCGKEHDSEVGGLWGIQVFLGNFTCICLDPQFQLAGRDPDLLGILPVYCREQPFVVLLGKFRIDRQPNLRALRVATRKLNCKLNILAVLTRLDVFGILLRAEKLLEDRRKLEFAPSAAILLTSGSKPDLSGKLHFTHGHVNLLEVLADDPEGFSETALECRLQLLPTVRALLSFALLSAGWHPACFPMLRAGFRVSVTGFGQKSKLPVRDSRRKKGFLWVLRVSRVRDLIERSEERCKFLPAGGVVLPHLRGENRAGCEIPRSNPQQYELSD
jgi:hypothetical protein